MNTQLKTPIKAISLWQPWAELIVRGEKVYETRHWATWHRGPILIHAAKKNDAETRHDLEQVNKILRMEDKQIITPATLRFGEAVAIADLVDCVRTEDVPYEEQIFGNFREGRWAWKLANVRNVVVPFPMRGQQGLFDWVGALPEVAR